MQDYKLILASASPRRSEILKNAGFEFEVVPSTFDEKLSDKIFSYEKIENLAYQKAKNVLETHPEICNAKVIGADTVVVLDGNILGKPKNEADAFRMLKSLSGKSHIVVTSICIINSDTKEKIAKSTTSNVEFCELTDEQIDFYITNFKPLDKAGAYGIQELPDGYVKEISGSYENIVGLCSKSLIEVL